MITRHIWEVSKEQARENRLPPWGKKRYKRRKETIERSFADAKQHHGHRYARFRGLLKSSDTTSTGGNSPKYQEDSIAGRDALLFLSLESGHFIAGEAKITPCRAIKPA